ncbi:MAG: diaminopimelate epimerase [Myxococcales bacterium]
MRFAKYHGLGNDFVLLDWLSGGEPVEPALARRMCDRRRGVGADGVLTLLPGGGGVGRMHVTNADGTVAQMCGNGIRCVAKYLADERGLSGDELPIDSDAGLKLCRLTRDAGSVSSVAVDMGKPELDPARIPLSTTVAGRFVRQAISVGGLEVVGTAVSMGNPHFVVFDLPVSQSMEMLGPKLETHPLFPQRANIEFAKLEGAGLAVTVWERGVGFTQACGTGACAAMVAAVLEGRLPAGGYRPVRLPGGVLQVLVPTDLSTVWMQGPAERVFDGEWIEPR